MLPQHPVKDSYELRQRIDQYLSALRRTKADQKGTPVYRGDGSIGVDWSINLAENLRTPTPEDETKTNFFKSPLWTFLSVVVTAVITAWITTWITQRIISRREKQKKIDETKLAIYMGWMPFLAELYARAAFPTSEPYDQKELLKRRMEILGTLQLMGPSEALPAFSDFCDAAEDALSRKPSFDPDTFHRKFSRMNYLFCCEIHGEAVEEEEEPAARPQRAPIREGTQGAEKEK